LRGWAPRHAGVAAGLFSTARYGGSIVSALLLAALLGHGSEHAQAFFAIAALSAAGSALLALRLGGPPRPALGEPAAAAAANPR